MIIQIIDNDKNALLNDIFNADLNCGFSMMLNANNIVVNKRNIHNIIHDTIIANGFVLLYIYL